jgi:hypothetical protein
MGLFLIGLDFDTFSTCIGALFLPAERVTIVNGVLEPLCTRVGVLNDDATRVGVLNNDASGGTTAFFTGVCFTVCWIFAFFYVEFLAVLFWIELFPICFLTRATSAVVVFLAVFISGAKNGLT